MVEFDITDFLIYLEEEKYKKKQEQEITQEENKNESK